MSEYTPTTEMRDRIENALMDYGQDREDAAYSSMVKPDLAGALAEILSVLAVARREGQAEALREEWSAAYWAVFEDGTRTLRLIGTEGDRDHAEDTRDDCARDDPGTRFFLVRRPVLAWIPADEHTNEEVRHVDQ